MFCFDSVEIPDLSVDYDTLNITETWYSATWCTNLRYSLLQCSRPVPERLSVPVEFLPLNYLTSMLVEIENQGNVNSGRPVTVTLWCSCSAVSWPELNSSDVWTCTFGYLSADGNSQGASALCSLSSKSSLCWIQQTCVFHNACRETWFLYTVVGAVILCSDGTKSLFLVYIIW